MGHKKVVYFDLYETLITEWRANKKKASYSIEKLGLDEMTYKMEWAQRVDRRMDGTFSDHQSVLEDIMVSRGIPYDKKVIEEIHHNRVRCKSVPFTEIDLDIIDVIKNLKNEI